MKNLEELRIKAHEILSKKKVKLSEQIKDSDFKEILHELDVYQAELEAQNEELIDKEYNLKNSLKLNQLLYDEAPFAYIYMNDKFQIININQMARTLFNFSLLKPELNTFYKIIAKNNLKLFLEWIQSDLFLERPLQIDLNTHNETRKFKIFLKKYEDLYLMSLLDVNDEFILNKKLNDSYSVLYQVAQFQSDMLVIFDRNHELTFINNSFLKFFNVNNIDEFIQRYTYVCNTFEKEDNFFHIKSSKDRYWLKELIEVDDSKRAVSMYDQNTHSNRTFMINIAKTARNEFICTFSEITNFSLQKEQLREKSYKDELTKVYNRAKLNEFLEHEFTYGDEDNLNLALIMFDIDFFKKINDNYGHDIGDKILIELCELVDMNVRKSDIFARWGGEEFVIVLQGCKKEQAFQLAKVLKNKITEHVFSEELKITCSFGLSEVEEKDTIESFLKRADLALYEAKNSGRNCIK